MSPLHPGRDDRGAVAILTAVLAVALFAMAALAVDATNALARRAAIQGATDQAARDAATMLPDACAAVVAATRSLAAVANAVTTDADGVPALISPTTIGEVPAVLTDNVVANGEIAAYGPDLDGDGTTNEDRVTACGGGASRVTVVAPPVRVDFGLARIAGYQSADVRATATSELVSALPVLPFAVSEHCAAEGPATLQLTQPADAVLTGPLLPRLPPSTLVLQGATVTGTGDLDVVVSGDPRTGSRRYWVELTALTSRGPVIVPVLTSAAAPDAGGTRRVQAELPDEVRLQPGRWAVRVAAVDDPPPTSPALTSRWSRQVAVDVPDGVAVPACDASDVYGDVLLFVAAGPELDDTQRTREAMRAGVAQLPGDPAAPPSQSCQAVPAPVCVTLAGPATRADLAGAVGSGLFDRLSVQPPTCRPATGSLGTWQVGGVNLPATNTAACYARLDDVTGTWRFREDVAAEDIVAEPRLFLVPVLRLPTGSRPTTDTAVPVVGYRAAFVTAETPQTLGVGGPLGCGFGAPSCNGIELDAADQVERITMYLMDPALLPPAAKLPGNGHPYRAGTVDVFLTR